MKNTIKNIIFDLGGVILDLEVPRTVKGFADLSGLTAEEVLHRFRTSDGFEKYERGEYTDHEFREFVKDLYDLDVDDALIDECWNAMLLDVPVARLQLLQSLRQKYQTFLLSNTNTIHLNHINNVILPQSHNIPSLDAYFHKSYYSHFIGKRKPEARIFAQVLEENNLNAEDTLFLDDNMDNIAGARAVGLQTAFVDTHDFILQYFS
jgi:glucose-1-phosphatase